MSEIRDRVIAELRSAGFGEGQIKYVLSMREIAIVDREAELPDEGFNKFNVYAYKQDVLKAGWVREIKE